MSATMLHFIFMIYHLCIKGISNPNQIKFVSHWIFMVRIFLAAKYNAAVFCLWCTRIIERWTFDPPSKMSWKASQIFSKETARKHIKIIFRKNNFAKFRLLRPRDGVSFLFVNSAYQRFYFRLNTEPFLSKDFLIGYVRNRVEISWDLRFTNIYMLYVVYPWKWIV